MIIRLSTKLAKIIYEYPLQLEPENQSPFLDWSVHIFYFNRRKYVIFTNTKTLYSIIIEGKGINSAAKLLTAFVNSLRSFLDEDGFGEVFGRYIEPFLSVPTFSKALNKSVISSMNNLIYMAKAYMYDNETSPNQAAKGINKVPFQPLKYAYPIDSFKQIIKDMDES